MQANTLIDDLNHYAGFHDYQYESCGKFSMSAMSKRIKSAIKIDLGDPCDFPEKINFTAGNLPYKDLYVECTDGDGSPIGVIFSDYDGFIDGYIFHTASDTGYRLTPSGIKFSLEKMSMAILFEDHMSDMRKFDVDYNSYSQIVTGVLCMIQVVNCSNVELVDNIPSRLKTSRVKKGRTPFFTYKTLHIKTSSKQSMNSGGGTHSSPRVHMRRGHIRTHPTAGNVWVQPCVVGDKSKGMVHKDYAVNH